MTTSISTTGAGQVHITHEATGDDGVTIYTDAIILSPADADTLAMQLPMFAKMAREEA